MFNAVSPYGYLLHTVYLFMGDIANPDLFVCVPVELQLELIEGRERVIERERVKRGER